MHPDTNTVNKSRIIAVACLVLVILVSACRTTRDPGPAVPERKPYAEQVPATTRTLQMVPVVLDEHGRGFWMSTQEILWDMYDVFVFAEDEELYGEDREEDGVSRPSHPYIPPDRGWGHHDYPVISVTSKGAQEFCKWLSVRTGRPYRLPTVAEWATACQAGATTRFPFGDDLSEDGEDEAEELKAQLDLVAWYAGNAESQTHPTGLKEANALGLHDMLGNAAEWCIATGGTPVLCGGSYEDPHDKLGVGNPRPFIPDWQRKDPQIPKSEWWLSDGPFAGFRVVRDFPPVTPPTPME